MPQFMQGDFILVVTHMFNQIKSYISGLITCRSTSINSQPFAEAISTLTEEQIKLAADEKKINVEDSSVAGQFLSKVNHFSILTVFLSLLYLAAIQMSKLESHVIYTTFVITHPRILKKRTLTDSSGLDLKYAEGCFV